MYYLGKREERRKKNAYCFPGPSKPSCRVSSSRRGCQKPLAERWTALCRWHLTPCCGDFTRNYNFHQCHQSSPMLAQNLSLNHFQHQDSQQAYPHHVSCSFSFLFSIRRARNSNIKLYSTVLLITSIVNYFENMFLLLNFFKIYLVLFILKYFCSIHNTL